MSWESNHPSRAGIRLGLNFGGRDRDDDKLFKELLNLGYSEGQAKYAQEKFNKTGRLDLDNPPASPTSLRGEGALGIDNSNPVEIPSVPGIGKRSTISRFPQRIDPRDTTTTYVDAGTSRVIREEASKRGNKVIKIGSASEGGKRGGGTTKLTPEQQVAMNSIKIAQKIMNSRDAEGNQRVLSPEQQVQLAVDMETLGLPYSPGEEIEPGFFGQLFGQEATPGNPVLLREPKQKYKTPEEVRDALRAGKIDRKKAQSILRTQFGYK